jgi:nitroreductase
MGEGHPKDAGADHEIHELIRRRWSPRAFDPARAVPRAELLRLFEAARWASSSSNEQPWRFVVALRDEDERAFQGLYAGLSASNQSWAAAAPVLALVAVRLTFERNESDNAHAWYDAGQAVAHLTLQATAQGLSVRQMAGFDPAVARDACGVPPPFEPAVVIAIGYAGDPAQLVRDAHRAAETAPRRRRALTEFVFEGRWGTPFGAADQRG